MFSIPQHLDFTGVDGTREICDFFLLLLKRKSEFLFLHSQQVANYSACVAAKLGLSRIEINQIRTAALIHDIGLLSVPNSILTKMPYLNAREMAQYKRHSIAGCSMLENLGEFEGVTELILSHHERWNGTGYPKRLKGVNIPLGARIIAVADYYDSKLNPSTQQWAKSHQDAVIELMDGAGTLFDPEVVRAFVESVVPGKVVRPVSKKERAKRVSKKDMKKAAARMEASARKEDPAEAAKIAARPEEIDLFAALAEDRK